MAATRVDIRVGTENGHLTLCVQDDGHGFSTDELKLRQGEGHVGLLLLAQRAADLGGELAIHSEAGRGTQVSLELLA